MQLNFDEDISIAIGLSLTSKKWKNTVLKWSDLVERLSKPVITAEAYKQFINASKQEQSKIKDVGGFVGGFLVNGKRDKSSVLNRTLLTLDIDFSHNHFWDDFTISYACAAVLHSTHKSSPDKPRHRLIIPLNRTVTQEEYQAISRRIAATMNIDLFDQSTFDVNRLMFWPSVSSDVEYYFKYQDGEFLDADSVLDTYTDWHDTTQWPTATDNSIVIRQTLQKQEDPTLKEGLIGLFCRAFSIQEAIAEFLSDVYEECNDENRYSYRQGSTAGGLLVYENKFAYSHHGTDPATGRLCNAFDLVRIHKFGYLDKGKDEKASLREMEKFIISLPEIKKLIASERLEEAKFDFIDEVKEQDTDNDNDWVTELTCNTKGDYDSSANNLNIILENDTYLKGAFKLNIFDNKRYVTKSLPWRKIEKQEPLRDVDYSGVRNYIECIYGISANLKIEDALALQFEKHKYHPIRDYLKSLTWDGKKRIDTLLIDYFGAEDNIYIRESIRKMLVAAVARVFEPGIKFDMALILVGPQGTYKSTFIKKLGQDWFSDTFTTVQGKESFEQMQGAWILEMAELAGLKKAEVETIKHFISKREDMFRPAYGRVVETYKRQCVFFGTTNSFDFLRDSTGNRRFLPINVNFDNKTKDVIEDMSQNEIDQIWAEAYYLYKEGEPLYLQGEANDLAAQSQKEHISYDDRRGTILAFLDKELPKDWDNYSLFERQRFLEDPLSPNVKGQKRDIVCIAEIWCELLGKDKADLNQKNAREMNEIMRTIDTWEYAGSTTTRFSLYGTQRFYRRKDSLI